MSSEVKQEADHIPRSFKFRRHAVIVIPKGKDKIIAAMRLGITENDSVRVRPEPDKLAQGLTVLDALADLVPHPDLTVLPRPSKAVFPERLDPVRVKDDNPTINAVSPRAPISTSKERLTDTIP
ncbi:unnamed protein product [marine sediment metagenome]|uniref:Uncharacterized protein n=1 Tax=marine sediment metagenome TaxID=412755 RepID=X1LI15_9ZZZZ